MKILKEKMTKKRMQRRIAIAAVFVCMITSMSEAYSQNSVIGQDKRRNVITTAVPSLIIGPDSRIGAMGESGVAVGKDINAQHWNPSKYVFLENKLGVGVSFSPWLAGLGINDIYLAYLAGYLKLTNMDAISFSLRYFSMGEMELTDMTGAIIAKAAPHEFAIDAAYSRKLVDNLSMAVSGRFIYSHLSNYTASGNQDDIKPGMAGAADISLFYTKDLKATTVDNHNIAWGLCLSNLGSRVSYSNSNTYRSFLPANFRVGVAYTLGMDKFNKITFSFDLNKYLVPTPPLYATDSSGGVIKNGDDPVIAKGRDPRKTSSAEAIFTSWFDAPGGFGEEMREFIQNVGIEYAYNDIFFARTGFFNEAKTKGNRKYLTVGVGLKYSMFSIDACYILPVSSRNHPLENTLRFSLTFDFYNKKNPTTTP
jgi:hypothetical protein